MIRSSQRNRFKNINSNEFLDIISAIEDIDELLIESIITFMKTFKNSSEAVFQDEKMYNFFIKMWLKYNSAKLYSSIVIRFLKFVIENDHLYDKKLVNVCNDNLNLFSMPLKMKSGASRLGKSINKNNKRKAIAMEQKNQNTQTKEIVYRTPRFNSYAPSDMHADSENVSKKESINIASLKHSTDDYLTSKKRRYSNIVEYEHVDEQSKDFNELDFANKNTEIVESYATESNNNLSRDKSKKESSNNQIIGNENEKLKDIDNFIDNMIVQNETDKPPNSRSKDIDEQQYLKVNDTISKYENLTDYSNDAIQIVEKLVDKDGDNNSEQLNVPSPIERSTDIVTTNSKILQSKKSTNNVKKIWIPMNNTLNYENSEFVVMQNGKMVEGNWDENLSSLHETSNDNNSKDLSSKKEQITPSVHSNASSLDQKISYNESTSTQKEVEIDYISDSSDDQSKESFNYEDIDSVDSIDEYDNKDDIKKKSKLNFTNHFLIDRESHIEWKVKSGQYFNLFNTKIHDSSDSICNFTKEEYEKIENHFKQFKNPFFHLSIENYQNPESKDFDKINCDEDSWTSSGLTKKIDKSLFKKITETRDRITTEIKLIVGKKLYSNLNSDSIDKQKQLKKVFNKFEQWRKGTIDKNIEPTYKVMLNCYSPKNNGTNDRDRQVYTRLNIPFTNKILINNKSLDNLKQIGNELWIDIFGYDITSHIKEGLNDIRIEIAPSFNQNLQFSVVVVKLDYICNITQKIKHLELKKAEKLLIQYDREKRMQSIIPNYSFIDALTKEKIEIPCRFKLCDHLCCFDLINYLKTCVNRNVQPCPICYKKFDFKDLFVDDYQMEFMSKNKSNDCEYFRFDHKEKKCVILENKSQNSTTKLSKREQKIVQQQEEDFFKKNKKFFK